MFSANKVIINSVDSQGVATKLSVKEFAEEITSAINDKIKNETEFAALALACIERTTKFEVKSHEVRRTRTPVLANLKKAIALFEGDNAQDKIKCIPKIKGALDGVEVIIKHIDQLLLFANHLPTEEILDNLYKSKIADPNATLTKANDMRAKARSEIASAQKEKIKLQNELKEVIELKNKFLKAIAPYYDAQVSDDKKVGPATSVAAKLGIANNFKTAPTKIAESADASQSTNQSAASKPSFVRNAS